MTTDEVCYSFHPIQWHPGAKRPTTTPSSHSRTSSADSSCVLASASSVSSESSISRTRRRRLTTRCRKIDTDIVGALKPFVCPVPLCLFQLISLGLGPSLEHELQTNGPSVDLLIQLTYLAARDGLLKGDLQPEGISLEVPRPGIWKFGDPTVEFDSLDVVARNTGLARLIEGLPPVVSPRSPRPR